MQSEVDELRNKELTGGRRGPGVGGVVIRRHWAKATDFQS